MASSFGETRKLACGVCGMRYDSFRVSFDFAKAKAERIAVDKYARRNGTLGAMHERKMAYWSTHVGECEAGLAAAADPEAFRREAIVVRERYDAAELEILRRRRVEAGQRYNRKIAELGVSNLGVGQRGRKTKENVMGKKDNALAIPAGGYDSGAEGATTGKRKPRGSNAKLHELAYQRRMGLVGLLQCCICTWPCEIEKTRSGHSRFCPVDAKAERDAVKS